jgi:hypothetical protein
MSHPIWKFLVIREEKSISITAARPTVIQNLVVVPNISEAGVHDDLGVVNHEFFRNITGKSIPVILEKHIP